MAEIVAGAIAIGLGGYLAARTDQEHYETEERREFNEVENLRARDPVKSRPFSSSKVSQETLYAQLSPLSHLSAELDPGSALRVRPGETRSQARPH